MKLNGYFQVGITLSLAHLTLSVAFIQQSVAQEKTADGLQNTIDELRQEQPPVWGYSELASKSDIIIIAKLKSSSEIERNNHLAGNFGEDSTILIKNRLQILSMLKGTAGDEVDVLTLKWKPNVVVLTNYDFAELRSKLLLPVNVPVLIDGEIGGYAELDKGSKTYTTEPEYLLYLRKTESGKYVPTTGHRYSGISVKMLK